VRYTNKDKAIIAQNRKQYFYEVDEWTGAKRITGYYCAECERRFSLGDLEVDHIRPRSKRGTERPSNLQLLCPRCNKGKGARTKAKTGTVSKKTSTAKRKTSTSKRKASSAKKKR